MSTRIVAATYDSPDSSAMPQRASDVTAEEPVDRLQELILTRLRELGDASGPMSLREASRRAEGLISLETFRLLVRGRGGRHRGRITDRVAEGLSLALQIPVARVYEAAGAPTPGARWEWPDRFHRLTPAQREVVEDVASTILGAYRQGYRDAVKGQPAPPENDD